MKHKFAAKSNPRELRQDAHDYRSPIRREGMMPGFGKVEIRARDYRMGDTRVAIDMELMLMEEEEIIFNSDLAEQDAEIIASWEEDDLFMAAQDREYEEWYATRGGIETHHCFYCYEGLRCPIFS